MCNRSLSFGRQVAGKHTVNTFKEHTENNKHVKSANYHLNKLLSASAWSVFPYLSDFCKKNCLMIDRPQTLALNVVLFSSSRKAAANYS